MSPKSASRLAAGYSMNAIAGRDGCGPLGGAAHATLRA
jgi:hypothetical protein